MEVKSISFRVEETLLQKIKYVAKYEARSVNGEVIHLMEERIRAFEAEHGPIPIEEPKK